MGDSILKVKNVSVSFGAQKVLHDISFEVAREETFAIIGPNGSGKTVLFRALIGALPYRGEIVWRPGVRIGYVPQRIDLDRHLSLNLKDFLLLKARILRLPKHEIKTMLAVVRLSEKRLEIPLNYLSAGELQRGLIAFAMMGSPDVLLFDEPTAGVDLPREEQIYQTIHKLQDERGLTVILISHDLNLVYRYANKVICLNRELYCFGNPSEALSPNILNKLYGDRILHHHINHPHRDV